jgi:3-phosphoshikimate 1-carboxyvinyltransferase
MSEIFVGPGLLKGRITPPPSKSDAHRALICAALAGDMTTVQGLPEPMSDDIQATCSCLASLMESDRILDCGESGTTLRLLVPIALALGRQTCLVGHGRLPQRPLREYEAILAGHGVTLTFPESGSLPLLISGQLQPGTFMVPGHVSSQYLSGLLLALPLLPGDSTIRLTSKLESAPYVAMTIQTMRQFSVTVLETNTGFFVPGNQIYRPVRYMVERDYSQAAFWLVADFGRNQIGVSGLNPDSCQGDRAIIDLLRQFAEGRTYYEIDVAQIPDLVPTLAVLATMVDATTRIVNAKRLRLKESDRLKTITNALSAIGADIQQTEDGVLIAGGQTNRFSPICPGGVVESAGDHRIAMALAVAALRTQNGVTIKDAECVRKSYPDFFTEMKRLGGDVHGIDLG